MQDSNYDSPIVLKRERDEARAQKNRAHAALRQRESEALQAAAEADRFRSAMEEVMRESAIAAQRQGANEALSLESLIKERDEARALAREWFDAAKFMEPGVSYEAWHAETVTKYPWLMEGGNAE